MGGGGHRRERGRKSKRVGGQYNSIAQSGSRDGAAFDLMGAGGGATRASASIQRKSRVIFRFSVRHACSQADFRGAAVSAYRSYSDERQDTGRVCVHGLSIRRNSDKCPISFLRCAYADFQRMRAATHRFFARTLPFSRRASASPLPATPCKRFIFGWPTRRARRA